jgi:hypothetical protein
VFDAGTVTVTVGAGVETCSGAKNSVIAVTIRVKIFTVVSDHLKEPPPSRLPRKRMGVVFGLFYRVGVVWIVQEYTTEPEELVDFMDFRFDGDVMHPVNECLNITAHSGGDESPHHEFDTGVLMSGVFHFSVDDYFVSDSGFVGVPPAGFVCDVLCDVCVIHRVLFFEGCVLLF